MKRSDIVSIADEVQSEFKMGGLTSGIYLEFAVEVARRSVLRFRKEVTDQAAILSTEMWKIEERDDADTR